MARYLSGELVGLGSTRRPRTNRGTRPESYDRRGEPSGGLAGTARQMYQGGWAQEVAWLPRNTPRSWCSQTNRSQPNHTKKAAKAVPNLTKHSRMNDSQSNFAKMPRAPPSITVAARLYTPRSRLT